MSFFLQQFRVLLCMLSVGFYFSAVNCHLYWSFVRLLLELFCYIYARLWHFVLSFFAYFFFIHLLLLDYQSTFSCDSVILQHTSVSPESSRFYHNNYVCFTCDVCFQCKQLEYTNHLRAERRKCDIDCSSWKVGGYYFLFFFKYLFIIFTVNWAWSSRENVFGDVCNELKFRCLSWLRANSRSRLADLLISFLLNIVLFSCIHCPFYGLLEPLCFDLSVGLCVLTCMLAGSFSMWLAVDF